MSFLFGNTDNAKKEVVVRKTLSDHFKYCIKIE